jgi:hypothetical protein
MMEGEGMMEGEEMMEGRSKIGRNLKRYREGRRTINERIM